jgi:Cu2+-exporting ATPase
VSQAVLAVLAGGRPAPILTGAAIEEVPGGGVELRHGGRVYRLGSPRFAAAAAGAPGVCVFAEDGVVRARFFAREDLRAGFAAVVAGLAELGREVHLLSGDRAERVQKVARELGIPAARAHGDMSPDAKAAYVRNLDQDDTMMVGDGLNDAPAFAAAFVAGTPALDRPVLPARADFCYAGGRPEAVAEVLQQGDRFHRTVRTNLVLGSLYNVVVVTLAFLGTMSPVLCAVLMPISSLALIGHTAWRLRRRSFLES